MRIRLRHPGGQATITLSDTAAIADLKKEITAQTNLIDFDLKHGYPPQQLPFQQHSETCLLLDIGVKLDGEQLTVSPKYPQTPQDPTVEIQDNQRSIPFSDDEITTDSIAKPFSNSKAGTPRPPKRSQDSNKPLPLSRKPYKMDQDAPEVPLRSHNATLVLRIMPDDNSCLFRAFNTAFFGCMDNMHELRSIVAQGVQADPETYSAVVLERNPDEYCRWIQNDMAWGGAIELDILSKHFDIEICSIDVQTLRIDRYNQGRPSRCILVYSGIHYDTIALSPSDPPHTYSSTPPDFDTKIFESADEQIMRAAITLCKVLQKRHYFTDTSQFSIICNICQSTMNGERAATLHAEKTGHMDFSEG